MDRRTLLKAGSMAALGLGFGGCALRAGRTEVPRPRVSLPPVLASWDRVIRTTVGLRPHRPSGFVLRAEKLDAKTVIHNYGHGGAGHSLGWGTGSMAADLALEQGDRRAAVLGCGTVGLTAARQLQRRGVDVTIYAMSVPPDTTSNLALGGFTPTSGLVRGDRRTPEWDAQFRRAVEITYRQLQLLVGRDYGVSWIDSYSTMDELRPPRTRADTSGLLPSNLRTGRVVLQPGDHPFPLRYATRRPTLRIEPSIYLAALVRDFLYFGGRLVIRKLDTPRDLMLLSESLIVNCTGLGSRALFGDAELTPLKGQLTVLVPQADVNYRTSGGIRRSRDEGGIGIHMMPRSDGIALGGTAELGVWTLEPNEEASRRIVEGHIELFAAMRPPDPGVRFASSGPPVTTPSVESFFDLES